MESPRIIHPEPSSLYRRDIWAAQLQEFSRCRATVGDCRLPCVAPYRENARFDLRALDYRDKQGNSPLLLAASVGQVESVDALIAAQVQLEVKDRTGFTALHRAATNGHVKVAELLLLKGADLEARSKQGYTPLMNACAAAEPAVVKLLLESGANAKATASNGGTAMHQAAYGGDRTELLYPNQHS